MESTGGNQNRTIIEILEKYVWRSFAGTCMDTDVGRILPARLAKTWPASYSKNINLLYEPIAELYF